MSEAISIKIQDIDSRKMRIFVREGKKDRYTVLPKASLDMLRKYYKMYKPKHQLYSCCEYGVISR